MARERCAPKKAATFEIGSIDAIVTMVSAGLGVSVIPKVRHANFAAPVRELSLGRYAPTRQISFICRSADRENRRIVAVREALATSFARREAKSTPDFAAGEGRK